MTSERITKLAKVADANTASKNNNNNNFKPEWKMFFDLQCPYSKALWTKMVPELKKRFGGEYKISTHITSLAFHRQSFPAHCAAKLIGIHKGPETRHKFEDALFVHQDRFDDGPAEMMTPPELNQVFCNIAKEEGILDDEEFTEKFFLDSLGNFKEVVLPTWFEHKEALALGVFKAPQHVINGKLVPDTESSWGIEDYEAALKEL